MEDNTLKLILDNVTEDYAAAKERIKRDAPKIAAAVKKHVFRLALIFLASFLITVPILFLGITNESRTLIVIAGTIRALVTLAFLITISPILLVIEMLANGISGSVKQTISFIKGVFVAELIITVLAAWFPLKNNPDMILMFFLLSTLAVFLSSKMLTRKIAIALIACLLFLTVLSFFAPYSLQFLWNQLSGIDAKAGMPERVDKAMTCDGFERGDYPFFGDKGKPLKYFHKNNATGEIEVFVLTSKNKTHPVNGVLLKPVGANDIEQLKNQVCEKEARQKLEAEIASTQVLLAQYNSGNQPQSPTASDQASAAEPQTADPADERKEYAVIAANGNLAKEPRLGKAIVEWIGSDRSFYAPDSQRDIRLFENGLDDDARKQMAKSAKKIIYAVCKTKCFREFPDINCCYASTSFSVINADSGLIISNEPSGTFVGRDKTITRAIKISHEQALGLFKNQCKKSL